MTKLTFALSALLFSAQPALASHDMTDAEIFSLSVFTCVKNNKVLNVTFSESAEKVLTAEIRVTPMRNGVLRQELTVNDFVPVEYVPVGTHGKIVRSLGQNGKSDFSYRDTVEDERLLTIKVAGQSYTFKNRMQECFLNGMNLF